MPKDVQPSVTITMPESERCASQTPELMTLAFETQASGPVEDPQTGDVTFWATAVDKNAKPNRKGFIFAWDTPQDVLLDSFRKNPIMLYAHDDFSKMPVGQWRQIEVTGDKVRLFGWIPGGAQYEDIAPVRNRVRDGLLNAVSIGFYIRKAERVEPQSPGDVAHGEPEQYVRIKSFELVECSVCPIGAHESAVIDRMKARPQHSLDVPQDAGWDTKELFDTAKGGVKGTLYRLSLTAPKPQDETPPDDHTGAGYRDPKDAGIGQDSNPDLLRTQPVRKPRLPVVESQVKIVYQAEGMDELMAVCKEIHGMCAMLKDMLGDMLDEQKQVEGRNDDLAGEQEKPAGPLTPQCCAHGEHPDPDAQRAEPEAQKTTTPAELMAALEPSMRDVVRQVLDGLPQFKALAKAKAAAEVAQQAAQRRQNRRRFLTHA